MCTNKGIELEESCRNFDHRAITVENTFLGENTGNF